MVLTACLLLSAGASAQLRAGKGSFGTEVQFYPFDREDDSSELLGLRFRYFMTNNDALRLKLGFGFESADDNSYSGKRADFSFDVGYERHFRINKRLDLYAGAQVGMYRHFVSADAVCTVPVNDGTYHTYQVSYENCLPDGNGGVGEMAYRGVAGSVFMGMDCYVYKGLYVGTEIGVGVASHKTCKARCTVWNEDPVELDLKQRSTVLKVLKPMVRVGWTF